MRKPAYLLLFAWMLLSLSACKSTSKTGDRPAARPGVSKASEMALFNTYENSNSILSYTLKRHIYLPGLSQIDHLENYQGLQFLNNENTARINIDGKLATKENFEEFVIIPEFGEELDRWLSFLPNPLMPHTFNDETMNRLRPLFRDQNEGGRSDKYAILETDKNWILENVPGEKLIVIPDKLSIITDPETGTIYQYIFEFKGKNEPIQKHVISFEDYTKTQGIHYPQVITRTTYLRELMPEEEKELQDQIVQNLELMEEYENNLSACNDFEDKNQRKYCRKKWQGSIEAIEIINEMMIDRVSTLVYDIKINNIHFR